MTLASLRKELISIYLNNSSGGVDTREARSAADTILCSYVGMYFSKLISSLDNEIAADDAAACISMVKRVCAGEPVQYVCGRTEFAGRDFIIDKSVLIPRPDTEFLLNEALARIRCLIDRSSASGRGLEVLDLCTGSGIIAISIKSEIPEITVSASDVSESALEIARLNAKKHNAVIDFYLSDLFLSIPEGKCFDIIVSNPPYISDEEFESLDASVKCFEPELALKGGLDGADFYRRITAGSAEFLKKGGWLCFEIGDTQADTVTQIMKREGFAELTVTCDIEGRDRVVCGKLE